MRANYERFVGMRRFDALDGLRAVSVVAVVWHHTSGTPGPAIADKGYLGVDFFFAISGFLITTLLVREHDSTGRISLRNFYRRRVLRIFPLYYLTLLVYVMLVAATWHGTPAATEWFHHLPAFATYTTNWFVVDDSVSFYVAWSLATEEQFYLLWPPLLMVVLMISGRTRRVWPMLAVLVALIAVSQVSKLFADTSVLAWRILASLSLPILLGAAAALILNDRRGFAAVGAVLGRSWSAPLAVVLLAGALAMNAPQQVIQILMAVIVVSTCVLERTPLHPILRWRPLVFVGVISYGVYLLHMLCADADSRILHQPKGITLFAATLLTVIAVAYLSFRYVETPFLRLKRRFETRDEVDGDEFTRIATVPKNVNPNGEVMRADPVVNDRVDTCSAHTVPTDRGNRGLGVDP